MGVTGCGKTTLGTRLAAAINWEFIEGDDFHSPENVGKMRRGLPLNDDDRHSWLEQICAEIDRVQTDGRSAVLACSALTQRYRARLELGRPQVTFIYLKIELGLARARLSSRSGHFAGPELIESQFEILEEPEGLTLDAGQCVEELLNLALRTVQKPGQSPPDNSPL